MSTNTIFLLLEYTAIPVGLMGYNFIIKQLASADPVPSAAKKEEHTHYGLELMQIISVSTLLYGLGHFGHSDEGNFFNKNTIVPVLISFGFFISEFFAIIYVTLKVRTWGKINRKTKICTNSVAFLFWLMLVGLIIGAPYEKPKIESLSSLSHEQQKNLTDTTKPFNIPDTYSSANVDSAIIHDPLNNRFQNRKSNDQINSNNSSLKQTYFYLTTGVIIILVIIIFTVMQFSIRRKKKTILIDYSKGAALMSKDPTTAIGRLRHLLTNAPTNSPIFIDTHMKLARIYDELGEPQRALSQLEILSASGAYEKYSYLRTGILSFKFDLLLKTDQYEEAEKIISEITLPETSEKLQLKLLKARKLKS